MEPAVARTESAGVFGGGGWFGVAFALGVLDGLLSHGIDLSASPMLGTSAGAWAAAATATGVTLDDLDGLGYPRIPDPRPGALHRFACSLFGASYAENVSAVTTELPSLARTVLRGSSHPLADLVAASSALTPVFAPHRVDGKLYLDGGMRSACSVDIAPDADLLVVIAPLAGAMFGPLGPLMRRRTDSGVQSWRSRTAGTVLLYTPDRLTLAPIRSPHQLLDSSLVPPVFQAARALAAAPLPILP